MQTGDKRAFVLNLEDVGVTGGVGFIYVEGVGYVADRNVCTGKSYNHLEKCGYVTGKEVTLDGERYLCRILKCTEWDDCMDYDDSDDVWHWDDVFSWVRSLEYERAKSNYRVLRGDSAASGLGNNTASNTDVDCGFRPVFEVLNSAPLISDPTVTVGTTHGEISINLTVNISKI